MEAPTLKEAAEEVCATLGAIRCARGRVHHALKRVKAEHPDWPDDLLFEAAAVVVRPPEGTTHRERAR